MAEDLRKETLKAQAAYRRYEEEDRERTNHNFRHWSAAIEAHKSGWRPPTPRFPVAISPKSPISTPEKLREIAGLETVPEVFEATYTTLDGEPDEDHLDENGRPEKVIVGEVSYEQLRLIRSKTDYQPFLFVRLGGNIRGVTLVTSLTKAKEEVK